jgi:hypothetical protein
VNLPPRLKRHKIKLCPAQQRIWPRHRRWVRSHRCCVPHCNAVQIEFAHLRSPTNAGIALKPHDAFGVSLCAVHHSEQHNMGMRAFEQKYGIDLWALAVEFVRHSPDVEMRSSLKFGDAEQLWTGLSTLPK